MRKLYIDSSNLTVKERKVLAYLLHHIRQNRRCPTNAQLQEKGFVPTALFALARKGFIRLETSRNNSRMVTACFGKLEGRSTVRQDDNWAHSTIVDYDPHFNGNYKTPSIPVPPWELEPVS